MLKQLTKKKNTLASLPAMQKEVAQNLDEWFEVELTYASNAIEGNTLSRIETALVIEKGLDAILEKKSLKDQIEALNHAKAIAHVKQLVSQKTSHQFITEQDVRDIHKIILSGIQDSEAGMYRRVDVFIRGSQVEFPRPQAVPSLMHEFTQWLEGKQGTHPVRVAADTHYKFVRIHPFIDGNGRTSRLLMNLVLSIHGYPITVIQNEERARYLDSLEIAHRTGDMKPFYEIVEQSVDRSLDIYIQAAKGERVQLWAEPVGKKEEELLKIGTLAKKTNETNPTIRHWVKEGLLPVAGYTKGGYQLFTPDVVERIQKIRTLQNKKRLSLTQIKQELG